VTLPPPALAGHIGNTPYNAKKDPFAAEYYAGIRRNKEKKQSGKKKGKQKLLDPNRRPANPAHDFRFTPSDVHKAYTETVTKRYMDERNSKTTVHSKAATSAGPKDAMK
jgi:hypothetical protein